MHPKMDWLLTCLLVLALVVLLVTGLPSPQSGAHGQPQAGAPQSTPLPGLAVAPSGMGGGVGGIRRNWAGWREWRRADPTLINSLWRSKMGNGIRKQLGNAEVYIMLALLIGLVTVVIGCWLSDNCWSPEPDHVITVA
ncbi:PREDICTED: uncharacterized protein LOC108568890 [Nicrophorus vespilloides]|uniref:Uncharacterized protein LOC108568890 n=1 Tax=Nicrophorus vespilloides TaxID=110193 RepID=A0ABM1NFX6_NICVS|nr:PREDICTED: uncharacterized protein LOC108568890 [Nicrophorus vespilloides]